MICVPKLYQKERYTGLPLVFAVRCLTFYLSLLVSGLLLCLLLGQWISLRCQFTHVEEPEILQGNGWCSWLGVFRLLCSLVFFTIMSNRVSRREHLERVSSNMHLCLQSSQLIILICKVITSCHVEANIVIWHNLIGNLLMTSLHDNHGPCLHKRNDICGRRTRCRM